MSGHPVPSSFFTSLLCLFQKTIGNAHVCIHEFVIHMVPGTVLNYSEKEKEKKSIWPDPLGITTSAGVQQTTGTSPHEWQDKPSGLRTGGQVTKKPALLDPGGGSPLFLESLQCELHGSEKYNEKEGQGLGKRLGHHSVSRNHRRPDSEQATELASCPAPLQLWLLKKPQGE